jgi:hypothetical protein
VADFRTWSQSNLAQLATEQQADNNRLLAAGIAQANENARILQVLRGLMTEYERMGDVYCFAPARHEAYRAAKRVFD